MVGGDVVAKLAIGTGRMPRASSSDNAPLNVSKTASWNALRHSGQPQTASTGFRTASARLLFLREVAVWISKVGAHRLAEHRLRARCSEHRAMVPNQRDQVTFGRGAGRQASTTPLATSSPMTSRGSTRQLRRVTRGAVPVASR